MRPYKDYLIVAETTIHTKEYGVCHCIQGLYDKDTKETFNPSELPIWEGNNKAGYLVPSQVSDPYWDSCGSYFIAISVLTVFPNFGIPYDIHLPKEGWLVCNYERAKECGWD